MYDYLDAPEVDMNGETEVQEPEVDENLTSEAEVATEEVSSSAVTPDALQEAVAGITDSVTSAMEQRFAQQQQMIESLKNELAQRQNNQYPPESFERKSGPKSWKEINSLGDLGEQDFINHMRAQEETHAQQINELKNTLNSYVQRNQQAQQYQQWWDQFDRQYNQSTSQYKVFEKEPTASKFFRAALMGLATQSNGDLSRLNTNVVAKDFVDFLNTYAKNYHGNASTASTEVKKPIPRGAPSQPAKKPFGELKTDEDVERGLETLIGDFFNQE